MKLSNGMYTEECELLRDTMTWLEAQKRYGIKPVRICDRYKKGISDILICVHGIFVCAELKDNVGTASPHQELFIKEMQDAGAICGICRTLAEVIALVEKAKRRGLRGY